MNQNLPYATLTAEQLKTLESFEKEFNQKYGRDFLLLAMDSKKK